MCCPHSTQCAAHLSEPAKDQAREEALDEALALVNNVSKKRLLGNLGEMKERLFDLEPNQEANITGNAFLKLLEKEMQESVGKSTITVART